MAKNGYVGNTLEIPKTQQKCSGYYYILQIGFGINRDALTPLCLTPDMVYVINGNEKKPTGLVTTSILLCCSIKSQGSVKRSVFYQPLSGIVMQKCR